MFSASVHSAWPAYKVRRHSGISRFTIAFFILGISHLLTLAAAADTAAFDLIGPTVEVRVQRDGKTLPISEVPSLQAGDRHWVHPDLPDDQSVHYLMVVAFLRGATNPPPDSWFTAVESWSRPIHQEGTYVVVPEGAEEALIQIDTAAIGVGGCFEVAPLLQLQPVLKQTLRGLMVIAGCADWR